MNKKLFLSGLLTFIFSFSTASATGTIDTFTLGNSTAFSGQLISLSWSGQDVGGFNLQIDCVTGIKLKTEGGSTYTCDTKTPTSSSSSDNLSLFITNISGTNKTVTFRLYPKNSDGTENSGGVQTRSLTVSPMAYPISSVSSSATTTTSGIPVTISWVSTDLDGVNMIIGCVDSITASSSHDGIITKCDQLNFANKLSGASGSVNFLFKNSSAFTKSVTINVLPYIGDGAYDLSHSVPVTINVVTDKVPDGTITSFTGSKSAINSEGNVIVSWASKNLSGVNLIVDCVDKITAYADTISDGSLLKCGSVIYNSATSSNSSLNLVLHNPTLETRTAVIALLPQTQNGSFDGINSKKVYVQVLPKGQTIVSNTTTQLTTSPTVTAVSGKVISPRKKFLKVLAFGTKSDDISALQEFLSKNGYYPEGLVTGYFGNATLRAVKKFQEQNGIAKNGQAGYGSVGPMTRAKLNSF